MLTSYTSNSISYGVERLSDPKSTELFSSVQNQLLQLQKSQEPKDAKIATPKNSVAIVSVEDAIRELAQLGISS